MFQESKDELALILYGSDETNNDLADEDNYRNINVVFPLSPANWHLFEEIQKMKPGNNPADCKNHVYREKSLHFSFKFSGRCDCCCS